MNELKPEAIKELRRTMSTLGAAEAELAWRKISGKKLTYINEMIEALRNEVRAFREAFIPENAAYSSEAWRDIYNSINDAAARELSKSVDDKISVLEREKASIDSALIAEKAEVNRKYNEFDQIKGQASNLKVKYAGYAQHRNELATAEADYEGAYEAYCRGAKINPQGFIGLVEMIISRPIRLKVLAKLETEAKAAIVALQKRNKELAKELNLDPHSI